MKKITVGLMVFTCSIAAFSQPGELPQFNIQPIQQEPVDEIVLKAELYVNEAEKAVLEVDTLKDSTLLYKPFSPYSNWQTEPSAVPKTFRPEAIVYHQNSEVVKIVFGKHTFHFVDESLLRSWGHCSQVTGMGQCGGFVTTSNTFQYWKGSQIHRSISWQSHKHPCACFEQRMYDYRTIMAVYSKASEMLMAKEMLDNE